MNRAKSQPLLIDLHNPMEERDLGVSTITVDWSKISYFVDAAIKGIPTQELTKIIDEFNKAIDTINGEIQKRNNREYTITLEEKRK